MRDPCALTRSPISSGGGCCSRVVARMADDTRGTWAAGRGSHGRPAWALFPHAADDGLEVLGRGAAAAPDHADPEVRHELGQHPRHRLGLERIHRVARARVDRQPGIGDAGDRARRVIGEIPNGLAHVLGAGGAVQADHVDAQRLERREGAGHIGAEEHPTADVQRHLGLDRHAASDLRKQAFEAVDRRLHLEDVLRGLDEQHVDAAFDECPGLRLVGVGELREGDIGQGRIAARRQHAGGADGAGHETGVLGRGKAVARRAGQAGCRYVQVLGEGLDAPLPQPVGGGLEGARFHDVAAHGEERLMDLANDVGTAEDQVVVAPFQAPAAEVFRRGMIPLNIRTHRPVEDEDPVRQGVEIGMGVGRGGHRRSEKTKAARSGERRARRFSDCLTWPQFAGNRHERV